MEDNIKKTFEIQCITCGDTQFEFNEDKSWVKCNRCGKEYHGGYNELLELNKERMIQKKNDPNSEIVTDFQKDVKYIIKDSFKSNKNIKFK